MRLKKSDRRYPLFVGEGMRGGQPVVERVPKPHRSLRPTEGVPPAFVGRWRVIEEKA